jgi:DNA modification methylase
MNNRNKVLPEVLQSKAATGTGSPMLVQKIDHWPLERLVPFARNARLHTEAQVTEVASSIAEFGFVNPILAGADGVIIAGHARVMAARMLQLPDVPVIVLDHLTPTQRRALVIADNRLALSASWDEEMLNRELSELREADFDLNILGFEDDELATLLAGDDDAAGLTDEDESPALPQTPVTLPGDLWVLGDHQVLCGDATVTADVQRLLGAEHADLVFTDPPYNVDYEGHTEDRLKIKGDRMSGEQFRQFLNAVFRSYRSIVKPGASLYVCHSSCWQREFQDGLETAGFAVRCQIIWAKNTFAWGFGRYKFQHEPIFYCHVGGEKDPWYGDKSQSTLWEENKPAANRLHPTMKPVELVERSLANSSKAGDVIVDLFGGSGSTLIACERRNRKARLLEIDPCYVDVIVQRWQQYTGKTAILAGDGRSFDTTTHDRLEQRNQVEKPAAEDAGRAEEGVAEC